jgi:hypothetical protein
MGMEHGQASWCCTSEIELSALYLPPSLSLPKGRVMKMMNFFPLVCISPLDLQSVGSRMRRGEYASDYHCGESREASRPWYG